MKKVHSIILGLLLALAMTVNYTACSDVNISGNEPATNPQNLNYYEVTVAEAAAKIKSLGSGSYTIKVSGAITAADIEDIKNTMLTDQDRLIALDLSQTSGLTELEEDAFSKEINFTHTGTPLLSLVLPETVTEIGKNCFYNCKKLKSINAPGVKVINFGAFYVCSELTDIKFADELTRIGSLAFGYCDSFTELTVNAVTIDKEFAGYSKNLAIINLGPAVKNLTGGSFQDNKALKTFTVDNKNTLFTIIDGMIFTADGTKLVRCPPAIEKTEIVLPDNVTSIDAYAFEYCKNLETAILTNIEIISSQAFEFATSLTNVSIPKATKIDGMAFYRCESLSSITIPDTVTSIGMAAFSYDKAFTSIFIPASVTSMSSEVFEYWTEDQTINCEAISKPSGWDNDWSIYSYNTPAKATINWGATR